MNVYLDNAATTRIPDKVISKMAAAMKENYGNPSSTYAYGRTAKSIIENIRKDISNILNVSSSEIIFISGGTEADNLILTSAVRDLGVKRIITSEIEHHAVLNTIDHLKKIYPIVVDYVNLDCYGGIMLSHLKELLESTKDYTLVSLMHVNNEIGNISDVLTIGKYCRRFNALFHCDMVQSIGHYNVNLSQIPVNFIAASAHKFHGPKGVGFAYIKNNSSLKPSIFGGAQERGIRAGTESFHNIVGLGEAFKNAYENLEKDKEYILSLKKYFITILEKTIPEIKFNGYSKDLIKSTYTLVNVCLPLSPQKAMLLLFHLDIMGIACSKGSACQSESNNGSHVLRAFLKEEDLNKPSLRFSFSKYNTKEELDYVVLVLKEYIET